MLKTFIISMAIPIPPGKINIIRSKTQSVPIHAGIDY